MALSYEEGMSALRAMFPSWDAPVLAELLEANEGHLENTIDMVLTMEPPVNDNTQSASSSNAHSHGASARHSDADYDSYALPAAPSSSMYAVAAASPAPAPSFRKSPNTSPRRKAGHQRASRVTLPDDFLVLPVNSSYGHHELSEQEQRDAILAEMLQNEIFRQELLASEEFSSHFNGDRPQERSRASSTRSSTSAYPDKTASEIASETFSAMSVKFSSMSEGTRERYYCWYCRDVARTNDMRHVPTQR